MAEQIAIMKHSPRRIHRMCKDCLDGIHACTADDCECICNEGKASDAELRLAGKGATYSEEITHCHEMLTALDSYAVHLYGCQANVISAATADSCTCGLINIRRVLAWLRAPGAPRL
jgi:hypothetical protein